MQIDLGSALLIGFVLFITAFVEEEIRSYFREKKARERKERWQTIEKAIHDDECNRYPTAEVFEVLNVLFSELVEKVSSLTNRRVKVENPDDDAFVLASPEEATREAFNRWHDRYQDMTLERSVEALAFMMKAVSEQVRNLRKRVPICPVGNFLGKLGDSPFDVNLDRRRFGFAYTCDAVWLLCDVYNDIKEQLPEVERMDPDNLLKAAISLPFSRGEARAAAEEENKDPHRK